MSNATPSSLTPDERRIADEVQKTVSLLLREELRAYFTNHMTEIESYYSQRDREWTELFRGLRDDVSVLQNDMSALQNDMSALQSDMSALQSDVSVLKNDVSSINDKLDKLLGQS